MPKQSGTRKTAQKLSPRIVRALFDMVINFPPHRSTSQPTTKAWSRVVAACRECHGLSKAPVCFALSMNARQAGVPCGASGQPYRQPACLLPNFTPLEQISRGVHQCPRGAEKFVDESPRITPAETFSDIPYAISPFDREDHRRSSITSNKAALSSSATPGSTRPPAWKVGRTACLRRTRLGEN